MKQFEFSQSMPLYLVYSAYKGGIITAEEKRKMKEMIISDKENEHNIIKHLIDEYNKEGSLENFISKFKIFINSLDDLDNSSLTYSTNESEEDISSPMGSLLIKNKKEKVNEHHEAGNINNNNNSIIQLHSFSSNN